MILWRPTRPSRTNTKKRDALFIIRDWNAKVGGQEIPGVTGKFGLAVQNEAGPRQTKFCQENVLFIANTLFQWPRDDPTHGFHQMVNSEITLIIFLAVKDGEIMQSQQKQDLDLWLRSWVPTAKFRLKLKKVGKTTRPFRYDLNQIPYDYTLLMMNRFKGLDLVDRVPDELWDRAW